MQASRRASLPPPPSCSRACRRRWPIRRSPPASSPVLSPMSNRPAAGQHRSRRAERHRPGAGRRFAADRTPEWLERAVAAASAGRRQGRRYRHRTGARRPGRFRRPVHRHEERIRHLYNDYLDEATLLSLAGFLAIVGLLAVTLVPPGASASSCCRCSPAVIAGRRRPAPGRRTAAPAAPDRHAAHRRRRLQLRAVLRPGGGRRPGRCNLVSMAVASLTTAIGFGTLALSNVPVLHAVPPPPSGRARYSPCCWPPFSSAARRAPAFPRVPGHEPAQPVP